MWQRLNPLPRGTISLRIHQDKQHKCRLIYLLKRKQMKRQMYIKALQAKNISWDIPFYNFFNFIRDFITTMGVTAAG